MYCVYRDGQVMSSLRPLWEQAEESLRSAIGLALQRIDHELRTEPRRKGESRPDGVRILFAAPLAVLFTVDEEKKLVRVQRVWVFAARSGKRDRAA